MAAAQVDRIYTCDIFHPSSGLLERHTAKDGRHVCMNSAAFAEANNPSCNGKTIGRD
jgi:hypothetical protein